MIAAANVAIARDCMKLSEAFAQSNIALLFLKGLTLAGLVYRSPMLKMGWDIDVLIESVDLGRAAKLLPTLGYSLQSPLGAEQLQRWHSASKESVWARVDGAYIELHTRLSDNVALIPRLSSRSPQQQVQIMPDIQLATLATDELFAYLCVHGASSAWFRLKWISDFAGLLAGRSSSEIQRLYFRAQELGAGRAAGQAVLIANRLFETPLPEHKFDRATHRLAEAALRQLGQFTEPTERLFGTWRIHWTQLHLKPGLVFKAGEMVRQLRSAGIGRFAD